MINVNINLTGFGFGPRKRLLKELDGLSHSNMFWLLVVVIFFGCVRFGSFLRQDLTSPFVTLTGLELTSYLVWDMTAEAREGAGFQELLVVGHLTWVLLCRRSHLSTPGLNFFLIKPGSYPAFLV